MVSVRWREERKASSVDNRGLFPQVREVLVRRNDTPADAPEEQIDMSDYCTNEQHAIDRAKWLCQQRKYQTHAIKFKTVPTEAPIQAGSIIKVGLETLKYDEPDCWLNRQRWHRAVQPNAHRQAAMHHLGRQDDEDRDLGF